jgi:outer membrane protein OmpA-like peptidoglycan-associated protein
MERGGGNPRHSTPMSASVPNPGRTSRTLRLSRRLMRQSGVIMNHTIVVALVAGIVIGGASAASLAADGKQGETVTVASSDVLSQISAFSYREGRKADLILRSTPVAGRAEGTARVQYKDGNARISVEVEKLPEPASLGPYVVYVLWALTPDGRATNQGVVVGSEGGKGEMETQYGASQFGLIVTAEPHFAVTVPSTMIALYNVADDVEGTESKVATLTQRSDYSELPRLPLDRSNSQEIVEARYAVAIARAAGAERFVPDAYAAAQEKLTAAETAQHGKRRARKAAPGLAREAVIAGEDARRVAMTASAASSAEAGRLAAASAATEAATEKASIASEAASVAARAAADAERQRSAAASAEAARTDLRNRLNKALPTRDSERGLIADIEGVQFATGRAEINASGRESIAKFAGVVASYPGLRFNVEGHTDSTGSVATNTALSLRRAITVRDYLIAQGVAASTIDVAGLGSSMPIADNASAEGRARNRRVEIVVSGGPLFATK